MLLIECPFCGSRPEIEFAHGCGRFFNALRDTRTDQFLATYHVGERPPGQTEDA
jgi:sarcosine oxidase delta subunit